MESSNRPEKKKNGCADEDKAERREMLSSIGESGKIAFPLPWKYFLAIYILHSLRAREEQVAPQSYRCIIFFLPLNNYISLEYLKIFFSTRSNKQFAIFFIAKKSKDRAEDCKLFFFPNER